MGITVINAFVTLVFCVLFLVMIKTLAPKTIDRKKQVFFVLVTWILNLLFVNYLRIQPLVKILVIYSSYYLVARLYLKKIPGKAVTIAVITHLLCGVLADVIGFYLADYLNISFVDVQSVTSFMIISNLNLIFIMLAATMIMKFFVQRYSGIDIVETYSSWSRYLLLAVSLLFVNIYLISMYQAGQLNLNALILLVPITLLGIIGYSLYMRNIASIEEQKNMQLQYYLTTMSRLSNDIKRFKHDFHNILTGLYGFAKNEEWEELGAKIKELQDSNITQYASDIEAMVNIRESGLVSLLAAKMHRAHQLGIKFSIEAPHIVNNLPIKGIDFIRVVGIFIDNAIEAAAETEEKEVGAVFLEFDNYFEFTIINSVDDRDIEVASLSEQGVSSKGKGRGTGLSSATAIVESYKPVEWRTAIDEGKFFQQIGFNMH